MTLQDRWRFVETLEVLLPVTLPVLLLLLLHRAVRWRWRAPIAIFASWGMWLLFTFQLYYPIGFASYRARGENPMVRFDDDFDNMPWIIFLGAFVPGMVVAVVAVCRILWRRFQSYHVQRNSAARLEPIGDF